MLVQRRRGAFTLVEIMVVVAIMGLILVAGIPSLSKLIRKTGMRKAVSDVVEVCSRARAQAILKGVPVDVVFHPRERRLEVGGVAASASDIENQAASPPRAGAPGGASAEIPDDVVIEMLDINLFEYRESEWARVRFFPNGTSDELTLILHSSKNEWQKISLEVTTGLASVDEVK